jgi:hypothetical protein
MMQNDLAYFTTGSSITLVIILANLVFFLGLPMLVAYYLKRIVSANETQEQTVS